MVQFSALEACGLILLLLPCLIAASPSQCPPEICASTPANLTAADIQLQLGPRLSSTATIYAQDDPRWQNATARWQAYMSPSISTVVQPGVEADISHIVKYANRNSVPFLTVNRGHGSPMTLGRFKGIQIYMDALDGITISDDKTSVLLQGGVWDEQVINALWNQGYVTNTGSCGCVGLLGPTLGGGHGRWQGFYGLLSDTLIKLNVVLADGTPVTISGDSYSDLFWAMKGAGHNFGIVTSFEAKIFPRLVDTWYQKTYVFTQDKLEPLFEALNDLGGNGTQPKELINFGSFFLNSAISQTEPIIQWMFEYIGSEKNAKPLLEPFDRLGPVSSQDGNYPYPEIPHVDGMGSQDTICAKGLERLSFPAGLQVYNITAQRAIYDLFTRKILANPELAGAFVLMEGYGVEGVRAVDPDSSAYALRDDYLLSVMVLSYPPNSSLDAYAIEWGQQTVDLWNQGQPTRRPTTYVNYAFGNEPLQQMYGHEPWRLEKLRSLKKKYDPCGRFNYYNPITY